MKTKAPKRPAPVTFRQVSKLSMAAGGEKRIKKVIHDGVVREWVGIGWIALDTATAADYARYPEVKG